MLAKAPRPGFVKTRLCPPLRPDQAAALAAAFSADTLRLLAGLPDVEARLALDPGEAGREQRGNVPKTALPGDFDLAALAGGLGIAVEGQGDGDLGERMARLIRRGTVQGRPTLLLGGDAPDLPAIRVCEALAALERVDVVIVPASDGGYLLIGARRPVDSVFAIDVPWGGDRVFAATLDTLRRSETSFDVLEGWEDVDDAAALGRLADRLLAATTPAALASACLLEQWRREGVRF